VLDHRHDLLRRELRLDAAAGARDDRLHPPHRLVGGRLAPARDAEIEERRQGDGRDVPRNGREGGALLAIAIERVIGKSDINAMIGFEKQKKVMGCTEDSTCLAEIGGALGVDFIMVGSLGTLGSLFRIDLKLVDSKKAKVRSRLGVTVEGNESKLVAAIQKAVRDLLSPEAPQGQVGVATQAAAPAPKEPARSPAVLEAKPGPAPASSRLTLPPPTPRDPGGTPSAGTGSSRRTWAYVTGGTGLALFLGGAAAGLQAKSAFDKEKSASAAGDLAAYDSNKSKAGSMSKVADALFVGVGLGVGTWLFFTSRPAALALEVAPTPGGAVASISGGF